MPENVLAVDQEYMLEALASARTVVGRTSPRPPVGAVIVRDGRIVGKGATSPPFGPHAEVHALQEAGELARGADLYVSLEPCCVTIHTPPCTRAIIEAGIRRVVVATLDINPRVRAQGVALLREAGIEVLVGVMEREGAELLEPFATLVTKQRPFITAKWAMTLDGKLAARSGDAYWISNGASRVRVHNYRDQVDAIMIGVATARMDDPQLTVRLEADQQDYPRTLRPDPLRVVLATHGNLPSSLKLLQPALAARTCVVVGEDCPQENRQQLQDLGIQVLCVSLDYQRRIDFAAACEALRKQGIMHVLLEGGGQLSGNAFDQHMIDRVAVFIAPRLIGGALAPIPLAGGGLEHMKDACTLSDIRTSLIDGDVLIEGRILYH